MSKIERAISAGIGGAVGAGLVLLARTVGAAGGSRVDSFTVCSGTDCNTYTITLVDVVNNGDGTVTVTVDRDGDDGDINAVPTATIEVAVAGDVIFSSSGEWFPGSHVTHTPTGPGSSGDTVTVTASTTNFGGGSAEVTGTVPSEG